MVKGKNTVDFKPRYDPPDLRLVPAPQHWKQYKRSYSDQFVFLISFLRVNHKKTFLYLHVANAQKKVFCKIFESAYSIL